MKVYLVNPPNSGRSIPEERYGIDSMRQIFKGEPMALEALAGNIRHHEVSIVDLKADPAGLSRVLAGSPDLVGITAVTCEANTALRIAREVKEGTGATVVMGGVHASMDPEYFNSGWVDFIVVGLGKQSFRELVDDLAAGGDGGSIEGVARSTPGLPLEFAPRRFSRADLAEEAPPAYDLVEEYRHAYTLERLGIKMGFVSSAMGCPFNCAFCCISSLTSGRYLPCSIKAVIRDIELLHDVPVVRLIDANTFGDHVHAMELARAIMERGIRKDFLADVRSDTVVAHPELMRLWRDAGLRAVIVGFEEIDDQGLSMLNKRNRVEVNTESISILHGLGITIVGDFIVSPHYTHREFDALEGYIFDNGIDLPMLTILTPLPGTPLYQKMKDRIIIKDLDYYTLTNAVVRTRLDEEEFYERFAALVRRCHDKARI